MTWLTKILSTSNKDKRGFTLIELMVVVIVVGVLAAAAVPIYRFAMSRAYASEAKATVGTIRASELVYYQENSQTYLTGTSSDTAANDLLAKLGVDTTTNTWWHAGSADSATTNCTFGFNTGTATMAACTNLSGLTAGNNHVYVIALDMTPDTSIEGIEMALDITTGTWYHYWP
jgi:prepilin-type N-terminal cleavage/methylation domain-containing protein